MNPQVIHPEEDLQDPELQDLFDSFCRPPGDAQEIISPPNSPPPELLYTSADYEVDDESDMDCEVLDVFLEDYKRILDAVVFLGSLNPPEQPEIPT